MLDSRASRRLNATDFPLGDTRGKAYGPVGIGSASALPVRSNQASFKSCPACPTPPGMYTSVPFDDTEYHAKPLPSEVAPRSTPSIMDVAAPTAPVRGLKVRASTTPLVWYTR